MIKPIKVKRIMELKTINRQYFETKTKYETSDLKRTDVLCVDADGFGDAEDKTIAELAPYATGDLDIVSIARAQYGEYVYDEADQTTKDKFFKVTVCDVVVDEKTAKEKKNRTVILVKAENIETARKITEAQYKDYLGDWTISGIVETAITDVLWK